jgi:hypothetical protein
MLRRRPCYRYLWVEWLVEWGGVNLAKREEKGVKGPRDVGVGGGGARRGRERREALLRIRIQRGLLHVCTRVWS